MTALSALHQALTDSHMYTVHDLVDDPKSSDQPLARLKAHQRLEIGAPNTHHNRPFKPLWPRSTKPVDPCPACCVPKSAVGSCG